MYEKDPKKRDSPIEEQEENGSPEAGVPPTPPEVEASPYEPPSAPPVPPPPAPAVGQANEKKLIAGILALLLGGLGIHKFYLGYTNEGLIMLLVTVVGGGVGSAVTCGLMAPIAIVMPIFGLIEGIMYLTKSDEEFAATYITGRKAWF